MNEGRAARQGASCDLYVILSVHPVDGGAVTSRPSRPSVRPSVRHLTTVTTVRPSVRQSVHPSVHPSVRAQSVPSQSVPSVPIGIFASFKTGGVAFILPETLAGGQIGFHF